MPEPKKKNRTVAKGIDFNKVMKIWAVLKDAGDWIHINEISRRARMNNVTVRWYLDKYFQTEIEEQRMTEKIKLRFARLKSTSNLPGFIRFLKTKEAIQNGR